MAYRWKSQDDLTTYDFADAAIATYEASRNTDPGVAYVVSGTEYEIYNVPLTGTFVCGEPPTAPSVSIAISGTTVTVTISGSDAGTTNTVYTQQVSASSAVNQGSSSGDGDVEFTLAVGDYVLWVESALSGACTVVYAGVVLPRASTTCQARLRDATANAALKLCRKMGTTATFTTAAGVEVSVRCIVHGGAVSPSLRTGAGRVDESTIELMVPRQTGFPVSTDSTQAFLPGCNVTLDGLVWSVERVQYSEGDVDMAPVFTLILARNSNDWNL